MASAENITSESIEWAWDSDHDELYKIAKRLFEERAALRTALEKIKNSPQASWTIASIADEALS